MNALRVEGSADLAANMLTDPEVRRQVEQVLHIAGETTAESITMTGRQARWTHSLEFRCEPAGRHVDGLETAAIMDTHDELGGTMLVGCRTESVDHLAGLLTSLDSAHDLSIRERAQEATNIIGSAYLNGLRNELTGLEFSDRCFLPSPPRFLKASVECMLELAVGGQALGDRGWIADHRLRLDTAQIVVVWIPTCRALVNLCVNERQIDLG